MLTVGLTKHGTRFWITSNPTPSETAGIERYKRVDAYCATIMTAGTNFNAAWRQAVREITGVDYPLGHDFRLQYGSDKDIKKAKPKDTKKAKPKAKPKTDSKTDSKTGPKKKGK